ncbi:MAG: TIGR03862 family flavoprotein [Rhodospirillales bacterium]
MPHPVTEQTAPAVAVIGAGPAGLMAAEVLAGTGLAVTVYERMPSVGRKFLMAGRGGLNLTHSEPLDRFLDRYADARPWLEPAIRAFPPEALVAWAEGLGQPMFEGSSGRMFPVAMKASPLLRAWLLRLEALGAVFQLRKRWTGWAADGALTFENAAPIRPDATILALGGGSWPRLGSDGGWMSLFPGAVAPLRPSNCGFTVDWSPHFRSRFAGEPLKRIAVRFGDTVVRGEAVATAEGIEGGAIYALSGPLRDAIDADGGATLLLDLRPDIDEPTLSERLNRPRGGQSVSTFLRKHAGLPPVAIGLVQEALHKAGGDLAALVKALPIRLLAARPIARAISSAGGIRRDAVDADCMLHDRPGVFVAGEMLDWEAPTGGYLLQADFSTGVAAARGAMGWIGSRANAIA